MNKINQKGFSFLNGLKGFLINHYVVAIVGFKSLLQYD